MHHLLRITIAACAAATASGIIVSPDACDAGWSGLRAYVGHPQEAWSGSSSCEPCNRFCSDLRRYNRRLKSLGGKGWRVGYAEAGGGEPNRIVVLRAMDGESVPYFVGVLDGVEIDRRIDGYDPADPARDIDAILRLDPLGTKIVEPKTSRPAPSPRTLSDVDPSVAAPRRATVVHEVVPRLPPARTAAYAPHWTWPGDLREHLARSHGYSRTWLGSLTRDELEALHDRDHDSGRVTPRGIQRWPAAAPVPAVRRESLDMKLLGVPLYRQTTSRSACPGGICPR
jgi:hypothetical protein